MTDALGTWCRDAGVQVTTSERESRFVTDENAVRTPTIRDCRRVDDSLVVVTDEPAIRDPVGVVQQSERNVVRIGPDGDVEWVVDVCEAHRVDAVSYSHERIHAIGDRLVTAADTGHFFELDTDTGAIIDHWPESAFRIGGESIEMPYPVEHVARVGAVTVLAANSYSDAGGRIAGFDEDGTNRWERSFDTDVEGLTTDDDRGTVARAGAPETVIDAETGAFLTDVGGRWHEIEYPAARTATGDGYHVVVANGTDDTAVVYGFEDDGERRWTVPVDRNVYALNVDGDRVTAVHSRARNTVVDAETGDRLD
ncbi:hypothetical protein [Halosimplex sp. TS25]|uniref:hypothetical protein n=1 Tax=Halosimplex rarum TaxID=3396619 RepID=UPI0039EC2566